MTQLGDSITRIDARAKVTGEALYPGDINLPGQLWMKVLFARRPRARIKRLARSRYLNYQSMIKQWLSERLEQELRER